MFLRMKGAGLSAELSVDCPADNFPFWVASINLSDLLFLQRSFTLCHLSAHVSIPTVIQNLEWPNQQVYHTLGNLLKAIFSM